MKNSVESLFSSSTIGSFGATLLLKAVQGDKRPKPCAGPSGNVMGLAHDQTAPSPSHRQRVKSSALGLTLRPLSMTPTQLGSRGQLQRVWSKAVRRRGFSSITSSHGTSTVAGTEQKTLLRSKTKGQGGQGPWMHSSSNPIQREVTRGNNKTYSKIAPR